MSPKLVEYACKWEDYLATLENQSLEWFVEHREEILQKLEENKAETVSLSADYIKMAKNTESNEIEESALMALSWLAQSYVMASGIIAHLKALP